MNVRAEIGRHSDPADAPVLLWLLSEYSSGSQWSFVASCSFERWGDQSYQTHRVWAPTDEGRIIYQYSNPEPQS
jgi:hypothetical protein